MIAMSEKCPGSSFLRTPTLEIKTCPECGGEVEIFSTDPNVLCGKCNFTIYNNIESCIQWCQYAKDCVGENVYNKLIKK